MNRAVTVSPKNLTLLLVCALALSTGCKDEAPAETSEEAGTAGQKTVTKAVAAEAPKPGLLFPEDVLVVSGPEGAGVTQLLREVSRGGRAACVSLSFLCFSRCLSLSFLHFCCLSFSFTHSLV